MSAWTGWIAKVRTSGKPWLADEVWHKIRRGWILSSDGFRKEMLNRLGGALGKGKRDSYGGEEFHSLDESRATALINAGLAKLKLDESGMSSMLKPSSEKYALAWPARRHTFVGNG